MADVVWRRMRSSSGGRNMECMFRSCGVEMKATVEGGEGKEGKEGKEGFTLLYPIHAHPEQFRVTE